jgi:hypothetical protein
MRLLTMHPNGFWLLGAIFLCTTGAEALYSDLGHCGRKNIRISWIFVKTTLVLNYLGQGAWVLLQHKDNLWRCQPLLSRSCPAALPAAGDHPGDRGFDHCQPGPDQRFLYPDQ